MQRILILSVLVLAGTTERGWSGPFPCLNCGVHCITPPCPKCPDCSGPCNCLRDHLWPWQDCLSRKHVEDLQQGDCCCRICAARMLGCRLDANICCQPEVLQALNEALLCDPCWEVRRAAAWSLKRQDARIESTILMLYVSSKLDPHFLVRDRATEALDILMRCRKDCYKDLLAHADVLIKELRKKKYKPGSENCRIVFAEACSECDKKAEAAPTSALAGATQP